MNQSHTGQLWLEPVLERHLVEVSAPDELWNRVRNPIASQPVLVARTPLLALAAAVMLMAGAVWTLLPLRSHQASREALAIEALARNPEDLDLRSETVPEIRAWVKSRTGLDLPLPARTAKAVRLAGACAVNLGTAGVEVSYRVSGRNAVLLVSKATAAEAQEKHRFLKCESIGNRRVSSWTMRGQLYTLAVAAIGDARDECLLCHAGAQQLTLSN